MLFGGKFILLCYVNEEINFVGKDKQNHFPVTIDDYDFNDTISLFSITINLILLSSTSDHAYVHIVLN